MTEPIVTYPMTEPSDKDAEIKRLQLLLEFAEAHAKCRFALVSFPEDVTCAPMAVLTTSSSEPSNFERHLFACFAPAVLDRRAAFDAGIARGIAEVCESVYGTNDKVPARWNERVRSLSESVAKASIGAAEITRIAVAPFGIALQTSDEASFWRRPEDIANDPKEEVNR